MKNYSKSKIFSGLGGGLILCLVGVATLAQAEIFTKDGYEVDAQCKYNKTDQKVKAWGSVKGGSACSELGVTMLLTDGKQTREFQTSIKDYQPTAEGYEIESQSKQVNKGKKKDWRVYQVNVECF